MGKKRYKARTVCKKEMVSDVLSALEEEREELGIKADLRPQSREECEKGLRPCPFVGCKYHLYLDVDPRRGSIKFNFPDKEVWELEHTCALDLAERGALTLEELGEVLHTTLEGARKIEKEAIKRLDKEEELEELFNYYNRQREDVVY